MENAIRAVVLTISDRCSAGEAVDTAGPAVARLVQRAVAARVVHHELLPDEQARIAARLVHYCDAEPVDLILTVGGTGPAPRDVTPEATRDVVERLMPGFGEAMRWASLQKTPTAILSRGISGIRKATLIVNLPGSERGAVENLEAVLPAIPHGVRLVRGHPSDCGCCAPLRRATSAPGHA